MKKVIIIGLSIILIPGLQAMNQKSTLDADTIEKKLEQYEKEKQRNEQIIKNTTRSLTSNDKILQNLEKEKHSGYEVMIQKIKRLQARLSTIKDHSTKEVKKLRKKIAALKNNPDTFDENDPTFDNISDTEDVTYEETLDDTRNQRSYLSICCGYTCIPLKKIRSFIKKYTRNNREIVTKQRKIEHHLPIKSTKEPKRDN